MKFRCTVGYLRVASAALLVALTGCRPQQLGSYVSPTRADAVDATWVTAVRNCWPDLKDAGAVSIAASLLDPHGFRGAFPAFAALGDKAIETTAAHPIAGAPPIEPAAFHGARGTPISRSDAARPGFQPIEQPDAKPDAGTLCVTHPGSPVGFK